MYHVVTYSISSIKSPKPKDKTEAHEEPELPLKANLLAGRAFTQNHLSSTLTDAGR